MDTAMDTAAGLFESPLTALIQALKFFFLIFDNGLNPEKWNLYHNFSPTVILIQILGCS